MIISSLDQLLSTWGYLAVFGLVFVESCGIPLPGETMLLAAAVYAGLGHLNIEWVIAAAAIGAILGDNIGYLAGRYGGYSLVLRYGKYVHITRARLNRVERFYKRHGNKTVFFGRFFALLRTWAAFLAGVNRMPWREFLLYNAAGGILWAIAYGLLGYKLAQNLPLLYTILRDWRYASIALVVIALGVGAFLAFRRGLFRPRRG